MCVGDMAEERLGTEDGWLSFFAVISKLEIINED